jgi:hypothetical protein
VTSFKIYLGKILKALLIKGNPGKEKRKLYKSKNLN